jgi:hypothetical protein
MTRYAAYLDASGQDDGVHRVITVAGIVSSIEKWERFEKEWCAALARHGVRAFHMTDFAASRQEFKLWKGDKGRRSQFIDELASIIKRNTNKIVVSSVELSGWRSMNKDYALDEVLGGPYELCGISAVGEVLRWAKRKKLRSSVQFIFEHGDPGMGELGKRCRREGVEPNFKRKSEAVPFQAADLIAWKHRIAMTEATKLSEGDEAGMDAILTSLSAVEVTPTVGGIFSRESLKRLCKERIPTRTLLAKSGKPAFDPAVKMSP